MNQRVSPEDHAFRYQFEAHAVTPEDSDHRAHVRLAYIYLCAYEPDVAHRRMRQALQEFLARRGVDASKYHETMTRAWLRAVRHFTARAPDATSVAAFLERHPALLDPGVMLTHYSKDLLFSQKARSTFVEPDLEPIPEHDR